MAYTESAYSPYMSEEEREIIRKHTLDPMRKGLAKGTKAVGKFLYSDLVDPAIRAADYGRGIVSTIDYGIMRDALRADSVMDKDVITKEDWLNAFKGQAITGPEYYKRKGYSSIPAYVMGIADDIAHDPITLTGIAPLLKLGSKGFKAGAKIVKGFLGKGDDATRAITKALALTDDIPAVGFTTLGNKGVKAKAMVAAEDAIYAPKESAFKLPSKLIEDVGKNVQVPSGIRKIDRALKKQGAEPLSKVIRDGKLSGGGEALERELGALKELAIAEADDIFKSPLADVADIDFRSLFSDDTFARIGELAKREIGTEAGGAIEEISKWAQREYIRTGGKISLNDGRKYMQIFSDKIKSFARIEGRNPYSDQLIKSIVTKLKTNMEKTVDNIFGKGMGAQFRQNNKLLQTINSSSEPVFNMVTRELVKPIVSQIDATMGGIGAARLATGTPAVPVLGGLAAKSIASAFTTKAQTSFGRVMEKFGAGFGGQAVDSAFLQVGKDIFRKERKVPLSPHKAAMAKERERQGLLSEDKTKTRADTHKAAMAKERERQRLLSEEQARKSGANSLEGKTFGAVNRKNISDQARGNTLSKLKGQESPWRTKVG